MTQGSNWRGEKAANRLGEKAANWLGEKAALTTRQDPEILVTDERGPPADGARVLQSEATRMNLL
jgi:hypothetical protein